MSPRTLCEPPPRTSRRRLSRWASQLAAALLLSVISLPTATATASAPARADVGDIVEYTLPTAGSSPSEITTGSDGNLWFTEQVGDRIGRITTDGDIQEYPLPNAGSGTIRITAGPDGNMWFTEIFADRVGRLEVGAGPPRADLAVRLSAPATARGGTEYSYDITVTNTGPFSAANLAVTLTRPRGVPVTGASPGADRRHPTQVTWRVKALGAGQQRVFHVTVRATQRPTITATAGVTSRTPDPHTANNTATARTRVTGH
ncbi:DUF11 domain-containing protein [Streptomyces sp. ISL-43]|uniref:DUF11 domain-containing protein n=1 Tax=Streptomyces sp. ISL-43 TaxID=2819183 RepID=UPI001BE79786|nr:DUF11 domain-containing protein [Streptomyces sp. ISL-43]MBT2449226.1 DUF11 domain-containing protein [Streptomyces sp. ISL-43]